MWSLDRRISILILLVLLALGRGGAMTVAQRDNVLLIDGKPTALTFARGCTDPAQVPAYRAMGFNTLLVRADSPGTIALEDAQALLDAGEKAGLYLLVELANGKWSEGDLASPSDKDYLENADYFVDDVVNDLGHYPHLIGWIVGTVQEGRMVTDIMTFGEFLQKRYGTIEQLNTAWTPEEGRTFHSKVMSFKALTEKNVEIMAKGAPPAAAAIIRRQLDDYRALHARRDADFQRHLQRYYLNVNDVNGKWNFKFPDWAHISVDVIERREKEQPGSSLPSQLELARYKAELRRDMLDWWAQQILIRDKDHLVFGGGMMNYRAMSYLPPSLNGVFTECYPGVAEVDPEAHNPHAIDIARHGNRRIVLAGISAQNAEPSRFVYYLYVAALHGATGIGVNDWDTVSQSEVLSGLLAKSLRDIAERNLLGRTPATHIGIVYTPYAPGRYTSGGRPLYGYLPPFITDGPGTLIFMLRNGTAYGQIDYLSPDDLAKVPLSRYKVLMMLTALDTPPPAMEALRRYVSDGGLLMADIGAGTLQATGNHVSLPPALMELFRMRNYDVRCKEVRLNLESYRTTPYFPRVVAGLRTIGLWEGFAVRYVARFVPIEGSDILFSLVPKRSMELPKPHPYKPLPRVPTQAVFISGFGNGLSIFAPLPLYQCWLPGNILFEEFHRDLFGRTADVMFQRPIDFLPPRAALAVYADGSVAMWTRDDINPVAWVRNPDRRVYRLPGGRCEIMSGGTRFYCGSPGYHLAEPLPIAIERMDLPVTVNVVQADETGLVLQFRAEDNLAGEQITLRIGDGAYRVTPGSVHRLTVLTDNDGAMQGITADADGLLHITVPLSQKLTTITLIGREPALETVPSLPNGNADITIDALPAP